MEFRVEITPPAEADIAQAFGYVREFSEPAAIRWVNGIRKQIASLRTFPSRCPVIPETEELGFEVR